MKHKEVKLISNEIISFLITYQLIEKNQIK